MHIKVRKQKHTYVAVPMIRSKLILVGSGPQDAEVDGQIKEWISCLIQFDYVLHRRNVK